jgi:predicted nucleic acid-binding protein
LIGWLLDTHVVGALASATGAPSVHKWAASQDEDRLYLSILTLAEIEKGIEQLPPSDAGRSRHAGTLAAIELRFAGRILSVDDRAARRWGAISGRVKRETGQAPPVLDTLLAATALEHDLYLVTRNTKDMRLSGAALFNPWQDDASNYVLL